MRVLFAAASAAAIAMLAPVAANAQDATTGGAYANLGYSYVDADDGSLDAITGRVGFKFNNWVGVEGEAALGLGSEDVTVDVGTGPISGSVKLKHELAAYVVGFAPVGANTDLFARLGYGTQKLRVRALGVSDSDSVESFNYGIGVAHHFDGVNGVRVDWTRFDFKDGFGKADVFSVAYSRRF
jgi:outer membrane immunogenic protein